MSTSSLLSAEGFPDRTGAPRAISLVVEWIRSNQTIVPNAAWVPGASPAERAALWTLGSVVAAHRLRTAGDLGWLDNIPPISDWLRSLPIPPDAVIEAMVEIGNAGPTAVADLYVDVVSAKGRRRLGTFFTPDAEAHWMLRRWDRLFGQPRSVVDVGAGVGVFTHLAHRVWPDSQLVPVDINPVTLGLLSITSDSEQIDYDSKLHAQLADFTEWSVTGYSDLAAPRLILGNPPYTRLQLIPRDARRAMLDRTNGLCGARASLSALMLGASLVLLEPSDGICLLLPAQWLESDYASGLREWLWQATNRLVEIHLFDSQLFPDAQVDAVSLIVGPTQPKEQPFLASIGSRSGSETLLRRIETRGPQIPANWRQLLEPARKARPNSGVKLGEISTIRRGVATGSNSFFTLSSEEATHYGLPSTILRPYAQRARDFLQVGAITAHGLDTLPSARKRYLLTLPDSVSQSDSVAAYIDEGRARMIHQTYLARARRTWFDLSSEVVVPSAVISASARSDFAVLPNVAEATITNNLYGITWLESITSDQQSAALKWLLSDEGQASLWSEARTQADGLRKIEIRALREIVLPSDVIRSTPFDSALSM